VIRTRRQWLQWATAWTIGPTLCAARERVLGKARNPASWTAEEKQVLLSQSPWSRVGFVRMELGKQAMTTPGYGRNGKLGGDMPDMRPGDAAWGVCKAFPSVRRFHRSRKADSGQPVQFRGGRSLGGARKTRASGGRSGGAGNDRAVST